MSRIITFYSYKGGVGRTFALANIAVLLAKRGKRVLMMDWDLEAPGLHRYFRPFVEQAAHGQKGLIHLLGEAENDSAVSWKSYATTVSIPDCAPIHLIPSGDQVPDYVERVRNFSWNTFFENHGGGDLLNRWRDEWKESYDFVLVDSRTGISDTGGVCTIYLPDILVLVFSANEQSFERGVQIACGVQKARRDLAVPRPPLAVLPLPGRFDGRDEVDEAQFWLNRFAEELKPFYDDWLPRGLKPRQILELTKIPYVTKFSFGEPLPVVTQGTSDPEFPGFYLENAARLLISDFKEAQKIVSPERAQRSTTDFQADVSRIAKYAPTHLVGREPELKVLNDGWARAQARERPRSHIITFVGLGGEGMTSLVAKWANDLAALDWPGCDAAFAWSFYSQGTRNQVATSSDLFLKEALTFFGDATMAVSANGAFDKGSRLAHLVGTRRALLILDGLEPLQYSPTSLTPGELKDQGIAALLKGLAATSNGLCIVTTRYAIPDLRAFLGKTVREEKLPRLSTAAGVELIRKLGVKGTPPELAKLVEDVKGHALTLNLLGSYLHDAHAGDIQRRDLVRFGNGNTKEQGGLAFRVLDAYVQAFEHGGQSTDDQAKGRRALALLTLLGLFDRPAKADCLHVLWRGDPIAGLTELLIGLSEAQRNLSLQRLEDARLVNVKRDEASSGIIALDAHPLVREYFAQKLRAQHPDAWRTAHRRLYEHLCASTKEGNQPTLEDLQPLYQALVHGCQAGLQ